MSNKRKNEAVEQKEDELVKKVHCEILTWDEAAIAMDCWLISNGYG